MLLNVNTNKEYTHKYTPADVSPDLSESEWSGRERSGGVPLSFCHAEHQFSAADSLSASVSTKSPESAARCDDALACQ